MNPSPSELLKSFITCEASALAQLKQGKVYPSKHYEIMALIPKAPKLLTPDERIEFYFYLLRLGVDFAPKDKNEFPLLQRAYMRILPIFSAGYPACSMDRVHGLLLFGMDDRGTLSLEPPPTPELYSKYLALWRYCNSFWHIPGMLKKSAKFFDKASDSESTIRVRKVLSHIRYCHESSVTCLWFWALVFLLLSHPETDEVTVREINGANIPDRDETLEILRRYITAAGKNQLQSLITPSP